MKIILFDTETTGLLQHPSVSLDRQPKIIEIGAAVVTFNDADYGRSWQVTETFSHLIHPGQLLPPKITKITGLTDADLKGSLSFAATMKAHPGLIKAFTSATMVIAHNLTFDMGMIDNECARIKAQWPWPSQRMCTQQEFQFIHGSAPLTLEGLHLKYFPDAPKQTHRALDDVMLMIDVLVASGLMKEIYEANNVRITA